MKILVVDDEKTLVKGMKFNLENEGYEVECAYDGAAALELGEVAVETLRKGRNTEAQSGLDGDAARRAQLAGIDMVEVHCAHGYLVSTFISQRTNHRTDEFGGSMENRARFPKMVLQRIRDKVGENTIIEMRFNACDYVKGGISIEDAAATIDYLSDVVDIIQCTGGSMDDPYADVFSISLGPMGHAINAWSAEEMKKRIKSNVIIETVGGINEPALAEQVLAEGKADLVAMARSFIADPDWARKAKGNHAEDIRPCIRCHNACFTMARYEGTANIQDLGDAIHMARCALNPTTMQTKKYRIVKTEKPKRIAIIGGGIGGMESALVLAERGHQPTIFEKSDRLGGVFILAAAPSYKESDRQLIEWYRRKVAQAGIPVKLNTEVKCPDELTEIGRASCRERV